MIQEGSLEIPGWVLKTFGDCADLICDSSDPMRVDPDTCYIGLEHIEEQTLRLKGCGLAQEVTSNKFRFKKGDILFGKLRPYFRKVVIAPSNGICSTEIWVVRAKNGVDQRYLYYWMASQQFIDDNMRASEGTKMPRARWDFASQLERYIPPLPEQRAIARILSSLDDKIELNRKMNATLEAVAQALFRSWFVDFDPVRAKAEGRAPAGMDEETAALFPDGFEVMDGKEVPVGWTKSTIGSCVDVIKGKSYKSAELQDSDKALVTLKSFQRGGGYRDDGLKPYVGTSKPEQVITPGELIVSFTDVTQNAEVIGKPAVVSANPAFKMLIGSLDVGIIRPKFEKLSVPYLYYLFKSEDFQTHIFGYISGTTVLHLAKEGIPNYQFIKPSDSILDKYQEFASPIFNLIEQNLQQSRTLAALRDTLLPKLISGEARVPDVLPEATTE